MGMSLKETLKVVLTGSSDSVDLSPTSFDQEFACENCGANFETEVRVHQENTCPECGSENLERV